MTPTVVDDAELLYRAIKANSDLYRVKDGKIYISSSAFSDKKCRPSVDRSSLRIRPEDSKLSPTDGVTYLIAHEIRSIRNIRVKPDDKSNTISYQIDAIHDPKIGSATEAENLAHCMVICSPTVSANHFNKRVREALSLIATAHGFIVNPS